MKYVWICLATRSGSSYVAQNAQTYHNMLAYSDSMHSAVTDKYESSTHALRGINLVITDLQCIPFDTDK
jgi:hypothetical protein